MADTIPGIFWHQNNSPRAFLPGDLADTEDAALLERVLEGLGLREAFDAEFERTTPRWWGLWVRSPLSPRQCELLYALFEQVECQYYYKRVRLYHFLQALRLGSQIPLYAELAPPAHTDDGAYMVKSHCPYCHCWAPYQDEPFECSACGCVFVPTHTAWSQRDLTDDPHYVPYPYDYLSFHERARGFLYGTPQGHLGYQLEYFWIDLWHEFLWAIRRNLMLYGNGGVSDRFKRKATAPRKIDR